MTSIEARTLPEQPNAELDALVLVLNEECTLLSRLHYRMTALRLLLLDGDPRFIQSAAEEVDVATGAVVQHEPRTMDALVGARAALKSESDRLIDIAVQAPESHRRVLVRLAREIEATSRGLATLRDAVQRQAESGQRAADSVLDLTTGESTSSGVTEPGHLFHGTI